MGLEVRSQQYKSQVQLLRCGDTIKVDAKFCAANKALQKNGASTCGVFVYAGDSGDRGRNLMLSNNTN